MVFKTTAGSMVIQGNAHRYVVDLTIDAHGFHFAEAPDRGHTADVEIALVAFDPQGNRTNYLERPVQLTLAPDRFARIMTAGISARIVLDLPEGQGSLRIAVEDISSARSGSLEAPVTVPREIKSTH
jgi:hypothetical protein